MLFSVIIFILTGGDTVTIANLGGYDAWVNLTIILIVFIMVRATNITVAVDDLVIILIIIVKALLIEKHTITSIT